jgi:UDP-glucuronate 4-epimerase
MIEPRTTNHEPRTILVTGAAGFIGSNLVLALLNRGDEVVGIDNFDDFYSPALKQARLSEFAAYPNFSWKELDVRSPELSQLFDEHQFDTVVHLAARAGVRPSLERPVLYYDVNVMGTLNLLEAVRSHRITRFVFASSSSVYGDRTSGPFSESDSTDAQISPYGASKKSGELLCHSYAHLYGVKTTCLRFFTVYGPGNRPDLACYAFMDNIAHNRAITQFSDGTTGRDYTYVDDTVRGIVAAVDATTWEYEIINLGNSRPVLLKDMIKTIATTVGKKPQIVVQPMQPGDVTLTFASIQKAKQLLHWEPQISFADGIQRMWKWYEKTNQ